MKSLGSNPTAVKLIILNSEMNDKSEQRSLRSKGSPASHLQSYTVGKSFAKTPLTLQDLHKALDENMGKLDHRIDGLLEKRLSKSLDKLRQEIKGDFMNEIKRLKSIIDDQGKEIAALKAEAHHNADQLHVNVEALAKTTHRQMQIERAPNIIISGLPENSEDDTQVKDVLATLDCTDSKIVLSERIGRPREGKSRLLRLKFRDHKDKATAIRNAKRLRSDHKFDGIYVNPDLTFAERIERKRLNAAAAKMRETYFHTDTRVTLSRGILYQDGIEVDRASPHQHLFRM